MPGEFVFPDLEDGRDAAHHDVDGDQIGELRGCESDGATDDEWYDDGPRIHCKYMLETE